MKKILAVAVGLFMLSASNVMAQLPCTADFDCDQDVDASDVSTFLSQFGRNPFNDPCPDCYDSPCPCSICPYGMVDCGSKCVDPQTDEDYCGVDQACIGGTVCGAGEICRAGVCDLNCPPGQTNCAGNCVDTDINIDHCGSCGNVCFTNEICVAGVCEASYPASVPKTGQTPLYATGDDGDLERGVVWPSPRFTDNGDGTVTDNLTGLIWLKDANCAFFVAPESWSAALSDSNGLSSGLCGLTDGSNAGDWRLPNKKELMSLTHDGYYNPTLPNTAGTGQWSEGDPFTNVQSSFYWSSTTDALSIAGARAWFVNMGNGIVDGDNKTSDGLYVWPVRGGQ